MKELKLGSLISGTHRPQDLIPAFLDGLCRIEAPEYEALICMPFGVIPSSVIEEGDSSEWWDGSEANGRLRELFEVLDSYAPDGYYFGAHKGNSSDFGVWEIGIDDIPPLSDLIKG